MTIVDEVVKEDNTKESTNRQPVQDVSTENADTAEGKKDNLFSHENLMSDTKVNAEDVISNDHKNDIVITAGDKRKFIDSVVNNTRFEKDYTLFGGNIKITARSLTSDEANALAAWTFKKSVADPSWHLSGRGRKYILLAQISMFNGTKIPPMEEPLFETLGKDGKSLIEPGWVNKISFWENKSTALVDAVMKCLKDFDLRYSTLCSKAEDENFWTPDTH